MRVTTAAQAAARDRAAIAAGIDGFALMCAAGTVAAAELLRAAGPRVGHGVHVLAGSGNNGGDGYVVAAQLARLGVRVQVYAVQPPRTDDARRAAALAHALLPDGAIAEFDAAMAPPPGPGVVVDALLGTGAAGPLRAPVNAATAWCDTARRGGAFVVALDVPTGVDATNGAAVTGHVHAHVTVTFGSCKSGLLAARDAAGRVVVADIGLGVHAELADGAAMLAEPPRLWAHVPPIAWNAHKGWRGRLLLVGGQRGMAGAVQLAARGALASGAGLVRAFSQADTVRALQAAVPALMCTPWERGDGAEADDVAPSLDESLAVHLDEAPPVSGDALLLQVQEFAHAVAVGPGLGRGAPARGLLLRVLRTAAQSRCAVLLDADALTLLARDGRDGPLAEAFAQCAATRPVVMTPHPGEFAELADARGIAFDRRVIDPAHRLEAARALAGALGCAVLLKGTPTVCAEGTGDAWCIPRGCSALATGGTGDLLTGMLGALLAARVASADAADSVQSGGETRIGDTAALAACAAWVHGVAGERAQAGAETRGVDVERIMCAVPAAWAAFHQPERLPPGVLAQLPWVR